MDDEAGQDRGLAIPEVVNCAECNTSLGAGSDREVTDGGTFCRPCFNNLTAQLHRAFEAQGLGINYPMALVGALAGAAIGVVAWWGFTIVTGISFGLVAIVIGIAVGKGAVMLSGGKRSVGLQALSITVSILAFFYASYLVNRTLLHQAFEAQGVTDRLPLAPPIQTFVEVIRLSFGLMDLVFLAIVAWEAWKIPAPIRMGPAS
jgi:hypothetical protein